MSMLHAKRLAELKYTACHGYDRRVVTLEDGAEQVSEGSLRRGAARPPGDRGERANFFEREPD